MHYTLALILILLVLIGTGEYQVRSMMRKAREENTTTNVVNMADYR